MGDNELEYEYEISLKDLCVSILRKWRIMLLAAVAGAVLLGGYRFVSNVISASSVQDYTDIEEKIEEYEETIAEYEQKLSDYEEIESGFLTLLEMAGSDEAMDAETVALILDVYDWIVDAQINIEEYNAEIATLQDEIIKLEASKSYRVTIYAILGAFLGICIVLVCSFLQYCFDKTIHMKEDFSKYTGLHVLCSVDLTEKDGAKKKNAIDRLIDKFAGVNPEVDYTFATQCAIAAAKIQVLAGNKKVLVTGTVDGARIEKICTGLKDSLPQEEYEVLSAGNPMYHSEEILRMGEYELVLVESPHITKVKELLSLTGFLKLSDVNVVGIVSVEG